MLEHYFDRGKEISPRLCTGAIRRELDQGVAISGALLAAEKTQNFPEVCEKFQVIPESTVLAVADETLKQKLRYGQADWKEIQRLGVSIRETRRKKPGLPQLVEGVYDWNLRYDSFLGIMAGVLDDLDSQQGILIR